MPWTAKSFRARHNHKLTDDEAKRAAAAANAVLKQTGDEGRGEGRQRRRSQALVQGGEEEVKARRYRKRVRPTRSDKCVLCNPRMKLSAEERRAHEELLDAAKDARCQK